MRLIVEPYLNQSTQWPASGRHILAQYDEESVIIYQAYRPGIGHFAARHGYFGGDFLLSRMSWIKPGFLWMMYRSQWSSSPDQEVVLAIRIRRSAFDEILSQAVHSSYIEEVYKSSAAWKQTLAASAVRLQWDPDHDPKGNKLERRALQLGLRGEVLAKYSREWIIDIEDISEFAHQQYQHVRANDYPSLIIPLEKVYPVHDSQVAAHLGISTV
ncbi:hypothetical protein KDH_52070 [Dictyobacter sp. S3.2.2.5]|uniref:DUF4291 domain-containing protein n=1 Tax=Dictyobacter halimunensis TaxID=3026934 RepID=A0ABQ6FVT3_9CHLR|nr:hypothetical protein KDH_52070 [Dictyobacter sp. S3.2.2.5]